MKRAEWQEVLCALKQLSIPQKRELLTFLRSLRDNQDSLTPPPSCRQEEKEAH